MFFSTSYKQSVFKQDIHNAFLPVSKKLAIVMV